MQLVKIIYLCVVNLKPNAYVLPFAQRKIREFLYRLRLQEAVFEHLFEQAEIAKFDREELHSYRESQKDYWDWCAVTDTAERKGHAVGLAEGLAEGRAEGLAEGMQKGREEGILSTALKLKQMGMTAKIISEATGLSEAEISAL